MKRFVFGLLALVVFCSQADAQRGARGYYPTYSGSTTAIAANGVNFSTNNGTLFAAPSSSLQFPAPFSISVGIKFTSLTVTTNWANNISGTTTGFAAGYTTSTFNNSQNIIFEWLPVTGGTCGVIELCARTTYVNDGNWHTYCATYQSGFAAMYIDGVLVDHLVNPSSFAPSTKYWQVGLAGQNLSLRDERIYNINIGANGCATLSRLAAGGLTPSSGPLQTNLAAYWPMNNCNGTGCADTSGNGNNLFYDLIPPTCSVTGPTGTVSGSQNLTATATDPGGIVISSVAYLVDGAPVGSSTTSPSYSVALNTVHYADGSHTITATATNAGGVTGTCTGTFTSSNGVSNKVFYVSSFAGASDSNDCLHQTFTSGTSGPCATLGGLTAAITANPLIGGDAVLAVSGSTLTIAAGTPSTTLTLIGPGGTSAYGIAQNVWPGKPITIGTTSSCIPLTGTTTNCATVTLTGNSWTPDGGNYRLGMISGNNMSNVTVQGWIFNFNAMSNAMCDQCSWGIIFSSANNYGSTNNLVQNNVVIDANNGIWGSSQFSFAGDNGGGSLCNMIVQDNIVHGSTPTSPLQTGIQLADSAVCPTNLTAAAVTSTSNYIYNLGMPDGTYRTAGYGFGGHTFNPILNYNVSGVLGILSGPHCGNYYALETDGVIGGTFQGDEVYDNEITSPACDQGGFDFDEGTSGITLQYSYAHNSFGPQMTVLNGTVDGIASGNRIIRYNIFEDSWNGGLTSNGFSGQVKPDFLYNNNFYNGFNGGTDPYVGAVRTVWDYTLDSGTCPFPGTYIANNIMAATAKGSAANLVRVFQGAGVICAGLNFRNNDYWPISGTPQWNAAANYTTLAGWEASPYGETGAIQANPNFAGTVGNNTICYSSGIPVQPGSTNCPSSYHLTTGSSALDAGIADTFSPTTATADFYVNAVPNGHGGGYNMGADGAFH